jgi:hypothetical protein
VSVCVGVRVGESVGVSVGVRVGDGVGVKVRVKVGVKVGVLVGTRGILVSVLYGVRTGTKIYLLVGVAVKSGVGVEVLVLLGVQVGFLIRVVAVGRRVGDEVTVGGSIPVTGIITGSAGKMNLEDICGHNQIRMATVSTANSEIKNLTRVLFFILFFRRINEVKPL